MEDEGAAKDAVLPPLRQGDNVVNDKDVSGRVVGGREYVAEITNVSLSGQRMGRPFAGGREEISIWVAVLLLQRERK